MDELMERMVNGEYQHADSIHFNDSLKFTTPGGKTVYGGGGIMPDVYIPVETNEQYKYFNELLSRGLIYQFTFEYTDANRARLRRYGNFANFDRSFEVSPELFEKFIQFSEEKGVKRNPAGINFNKHEIQNLIKALISRNLYNEEGFYPIYLRTDETFQKALEIFNKDMKV
jgi:carboxyl-terminal processing protease